MNPFPNLYHEHEYVRHQWSLYVRQGIRRRIEMQAFDELDRYIKQIVKNVMGKPDYLSEFVEVLRKEYPQRAHQAEKLLLLL
jgi:uncharacterized short protein YbdD (DUF466 family)